MTVLALIAVYLDDRTLPPTIYNTIGKRSEFRVSFDTEPALASVLALAKGEFEIPDHVRDWVSLHLESAQDVESYGYATSGEMAARIIGAIGDAEARRTLDELAVDSNYPIETRQTAQKLLGRCENQE